MRESKRHYIDKYAAWNVNGVWLARSGSSSLSLPPSSLPPSLGPTPSQTCRYVCRQCILYSIGNRDARARGCMWSPSLLTLVTIATTRHTCLVSLHGRTTQRSVSTLSTNPDRACRLRQSRDARSCARQSLPVLVVRLARICARGRGSSGLDRRVSTFV